jgi:hypothetical protein
VAGSGASLDFGMPSVTDINNLFNKWGAQFETYNSDNSSGIYKELFETVKTHMKATRRASYMRQEPNYEEMLYLLYEVSPALSKWHRSSLMGSFVNGKMLADIIKPKSIPNVPGDQFPSGIIQILSTHLVDELCNNFRSLCKTGECANNGNLVGLVRVLEEFFEISVVTTNYDNVLYSCFNNPETGFDPKNNNDFNPSKIISRRKWGCFIYLHGSVYFDVRHRNNDIHNIFWNEDLFSTFSNNSSGRNMQDSTEGPAFPTSTIVAGLGKSVYMQRQPFRTYLSELDRLVVTSDALLIAGYGFSDAHLNGALSGYRDRRNRPVVLLDYASDTTLTSCCSPGTIGCLESAKKAMEIFDTNNSLMEYLGYNHCDTVKSVKQSNEFERSIEKQYPLSIWYGGMIEACKQANSILNELIKPDARLNNAALKRERCSPQHGKPNN